MAAAAEEPGPGVAGVAERSIVTRPAAATGRDAGSAHRRARGRRSRVNESYRFRHSSQTAKARIKNREQAKVQAKEGTAEEI